MPTIRPFDKAITDITNYVFHYRIPPPSPSSIPSSPFEFSFRASTDNEDSSSNNVTCKDNDTCSTVWAAARMALLDALGCAIETASKSKDCSALLGPIVRDSVLPNGFKVPGTPWQVDPVKGAFDMGVLIRYLDHNDALGGMEWGHPSDNLAAILAVMDWLSRSSRNSESRSNGHRRRPPSTMQTLLHALIKAYEIQGCYQMKNAFNEYGIDHVVLVKLASSAVVSWLLGLTEEETSATISQVWMDGHPSRVYRSGENTIPRKGWAAGDASMRAVHLALLTQAGQPGAPGALTSFPWGFFARTFGSKGFDLPRPFGTWTIQNILFKIMPVEGHGISAVEAALVQRKELLRRGIGLAHVARIDLRTTAAADLIINKTGTLHNAADRDHCIQYVVALAILKGEPPDVQDYADDSPWASSEELAWFRSKIAVHVDSRLTADYLDLSKKSIASGVTIHLQNGHILKEVLVEFPLGHVRNPATARAIGQKFNRNMRLMFSDDETAQIVRAVHQNDMTIHDFVDLLHRPLQLSPKL